MKRLVSSILIAICSVGVFSQDMKIYGYNPEERTYNMYLGKLNANDSDEESVWNTETRFGNKDSLNCIWNCDGAYGSENGDYSPFNEDAKFPPKIFDDEHNDYGFFTVDIDNRNRCSYDIIDIICKYHQRIARNVRKWHELIFS